MKNHGNTFIRKISAVGATAVSLFAIAKDTLAATAPGTAILSNLSPIGSTGFNDTNQSGTRLPAMIGGYISQALALLGIILVVIIIYAGFQWMTAQGDADKVKTAKKMIGQAVVGMAIILAAYAITNFVVASIVNGTNP